MMNLDVRLENQRIQSHIMIENQSEEAIQSRIETDRQRHQQRRERQKRQWSRTADRTGWTGPDRNVLTSGSDRAGTSWT